MFNRILVKDQYVKCVAYVPGQIWARGLEPSHSILLLIDWWNFDLFTSWFPKFNINNVINNTRYNLTMFFTFKFSPHWWYCTKHLSMLAFLEHFLFAFFSTHNCTNFRVDHRCSFAQNIGASTTTPHRPQLTRTQPHLVLCVRVHVSLCVSARNTFNTIPRTFMLTTIAVVHKTLVLTPSQPHSHIVPHSHVHNLTSCCVVLCVRVHMSLCKCS